MDLSSLVSQFNQTIVLLQQNLEVILILVAILYGLFFINWIIGGRLMLLGIYPRRLTGLIGIPFSPFIHADFNHVFFNSIPFFILASFVIIDGMQTFIVVSVAIIIMSGFATWLIGRKGFHVGASGLIMGYWSYLLVNAYYHTTPVSVALAFVCLYYFGGMILQVFPIRLKDSWEAHLTGFLSGIATAYALPFVMPYVQTYFGNM